MSSDNKCQRCGHEAPTETNFCPYCGTAKPHLATFLSQREGLAALGVTFGWTLLVLLLKTYEYSPLLIVLSVLFLLPAIASLGFAIYRTWLRRTGSRSLSALTLSPATVPLIALAWLLVVSLVSSDPGESLIAGILFWIYTLGVLLLWLVIFAASLNLLVASRWTILRRIGWTVISLLPLTLAMYLVGYVIGEDEVLLQARFNASESALDRRVRQAQPTTGRVGLYQITHITDVEGCVFLETGGDSLDEGFAYCPKGRPSRAMRDSPPDILMAPLNGDWENADWWTYDVASTGY